MVTEKKSNDFFVFVMENIKLIQVIILERVLCLRKVVISYFIRTVFIAY